MKDYSETNWKSPEGEIIREGSSALEQAIEDPRNINNGDASETFLNNMFAGITGLGRYVGTGAANYLYKGLQKWLPNLNFAATSTAGQGLGAAASNSALWSDALFNTATSASTISDIATNGFNPVNSIELGLSLTPAFGGMYDVVKGWGGYNRNTSFPSYRISRNTTDKRIPSIYDDEHFIRDAYDRKLRFTRNKNFLHEESRDPLIRNPQGDSPTFSMKELAKQAQFRAQKVLEDKEYKQSLMQELGIDESEAEKIIGDQIEHIYKAKLNPRLVPESTTASGQSVSPHFRMDSEAFGYEEYPELKKFENADLYNKEHGEIWNDAARKAYPGNNDVIIPLEWFDQDFTPEIGLHPYYGGRLNYDAKTGRKESRGFYETLRQILAHEYWHIGSRQGGNNLKATDTDAIIKRHNAALTKDEEGMTPFLKQAKDFEKENEKDALEGMRLFENPDEVRARAMSLRRLHQTTGRSYEDLINDTRIINSNSDIRQLLKYIDKDRLLNYLNHFVYNEPTTSQINDVSYAKLGGVIRKWGD